MEKLKRCGYAMVKIFEDTITRFDTIHEHDGQTDRQTPHNGTGKTRSPAIADKPLDDVL